MEHTKDSVLVEGEVFYLRSTGNLSTGGTAIDMTDSVIQTIVRWRFGGLKTIGLDVAGVDFLTPDITRSYKDVGIGICEVNVCSGFECI